MALHFYPQLLACFLTQLLNVISLSFL